MLRRSVPISPADARSPCRPSPVRRRQTRLAAGQRHLPAVRRDRTTSSAPLQTIPRPFPERSMTGVGSVNTPHGHVEARRRPAGRCPARGHIGGHHVNTRRLPTVARRYRLEQHPGPAPHARMIASCTDRDSLSSTWSRSSSRRRRRRSRPVRGWSAPVDSDRQHDCPTIGRPRHQTPEERDPSDDDLAVILRRPAHHEVRPTRRDVVRGPRPALMQASPTGSARPARHRHTRLGGARSLSTAAARLRR